MCVGMRIVFPWSEIARETPSAEIARVLYFIALLEAGRGDPAAPVTAREGLEALRRWYGPDHPMSRDLAPALELIAQRPTP